MSKKKYTPPQVQQKPRNRLALNPLLHKGGAHQKTNKAKRSAEKRQVRAQVRTWDVSAKVA